MLFKPEEFKTPAFRFRVNGKYFETEVFEDDSTIIVWFTLKKFPQTQLQNDRCVFVIPRKTSIWFENHEIVKFSKSEAFNRKFRKYWEPLISVD